MPKKIREPADPKAGPVPAFGFELRNLRQNAGLTYTAIADKSYFSKSAVHAVDQGHSLPSATILKAFVAACGADPQPWLDRRAALHDEQLAARRGGLAEKMSLREQGLPAPDPATVATAAEFNDGLKRLREWSGLTYKQIEERTTVGAPQRVAPSTLCGVFSRGTLPGVDLVVSFLHAVDLDPDDQDAWLAAWQAIKDGKPAPAAPPTAEPAWLAALPTEPDPATAGAGHTPTASDAPAPPVDAATPPAPDRYVIPTYLPTSAIRDWQLRDGQWEPIDGVPLREWQPPGPPASPTSARGRIQFAVLMLLVAIVTTLLILLINQ